MDGYYFTFPYNPYDTTYNPALLTPTTAITDGNPATYVASNYVRPGTPTAIQLGLYGVAALSVGETATNTVTLTIDCTTFPDSVNNGAWLLSYHKTQGYTGTTGWFVYRAGPLGVFSGSTAIPAVGGATAARVWRVNLATFTDNPSAPGWTTPAVGTAYARLVELLPGVTSTCVTPGTALALGASLSCCGKAAGIAWSAAPSASTYAVREYVPGLAPTYVLLASGLTGTTYTATLPASEQSNQHVFQVLAINGCGTGVATAVTVGPKFSIPTATQPTFSYPTAYCPTFSIPDCAQ